MKVFSIRFIGGVCIVAVGLFAAYIGILSLLLPGKMDYAVISGIILIIISIALIKLGFVVAKDTPKPGSKVTVDTLRRAKLLDKKRKK